MAALVISVPAVELDRVKPAGSVFDARRLLDLPLSTGLNRALQLVFDVLVPLYSNVLCVARPEMFTHGQSLAWLRERIEGAEEHLCISNGQTLKLIPGLKNQLFVYGLHLVGSLRHYRAVQRRAPELLGGFTRQYNTVLEAGTHDEERLAAREQPAPGPAPQVLAPSQPLRTKGFQWCHPFYMNRHSNADSCERMLQWGRNELPPVAGHARTVVIDCNETALHDAHYCHAIAALVCEASRDTSICLLLVLPEMEDVRATTSDLMVAVLQGVQRGRVAVPRVRMDNVHLCTELDETEFLALQAPFELVLHESTLLWAFTHALYAAASSIDLYQARTALGDRQHLKRIQVELLGRQPVVHGWSHAFIARHGLEAA